jgi:hypothetical protein
MMLQEAPDAAKLRKKVVEQQVEMASMRQAMKKVASAHESIQNRKKSIRIRKPDEKPDGKPETG